MKKELVSLLFGAVVLAAAPAAYARVDVSVGINPFGYGYAPPVVYQPAPYYAPPVGVYLGGGGWGGGRGYRGDRGGRGRGHR